MNPLLEIEALALMNLVSVLPGSEYLRRPHAIQTGPRSNVGEGLAIAQVLASREVCREKRVLKRLLPALKLGPMQQSVGVKGVVDPRALVHVERESELLAARP